MNAGRHTRRTRRWWRMCACLRARPGRGRGRGAMATAMAVDSLRRRPALPRPPNPTPVTYPSSYPARNMKNTTRLCPDCLPPHSPTPGTAPATPSSRAMWPLRRTRQCARDQRRPAQGVRARGPGHTAPRLRRDGDETRPRRGRVCVGPSCAAQGGDAARLGGRAGSAALPWRPPPSRSGRSVSLLAPAPCPSPFASLRPFFPPTMCTMLRRRKDLPGDMGQDLSAALFARYSKDGKMGAEALLRFLQAEQGDAAATLDDVKRLKDKLRKESSTHHFFKVLSSSDFCKDDFSNYLLSPKYNSCLPPHVYHDMTQPLSHYWIFTGHNSYLTGNQLSSDSSDAPIIAALQRGVRVVELDLWPDDKGGIKVTHGNTLTNPVSFEKCLIAIKENAFASSVYPVCVTLEDHLTSALQAKAAEMLSRILGEALYYPHTSDALTEFPSPESLKKRIIISTKPPKEYLEAAAVAKKVLKDKSLVKELEKEDAEEKTSKAPVKQEANLSDKVATLQVGEDVAAAAKPDLASLAPKQVTVEDSGSDDDDDHYARLITIRQVKPVKGTSTKDRLKVEETVKRISLAESKLKDVCEEFPEEVIKFTQRNILRVYPAGSRVDSSNYNPILAWNHGAQMVAQNMQGYGKELWQAHGKFRGNGGCGYILKPKFLLGNSLIGEIFNPLNYKQPEIKFKIKVMTTLGWDKAFSKHHFDLFSPPDFFTRVLVSGVPADVQKWKTSVVDDTWVPHWNEETVFTLKVPELALLRLEVRDHDEESRDEFEGQACLPIHEIRDGYRCVQLYDKKGMELPGVKMLFHFQKNRVDDVPHPPKHDDVSLPQKREDVPPPETHEDVPHPEEHDDVVLPEKPKDVPISET